MFERELLWTNQEVDDVAEMHAPEETTPQFVIEDDDEGSETGEGGPSTPAGARSPQQRAKKKLPALGEKLFNCLIDLLFCCGFTLPTKIQVDHHKINYVIWCVPEY